MYPHIPLSSLFPYTTLFRSGQRINRLSFDGHGTMDFVIHRHAEIALLFSLAAVALWWLARRRAIGAHVQRPLTRSEEHTSELQSRFDLVCRLLLEKKKIQLR